MRALIIVFFVVIGLVPAQSFQTAEKEDYVFRNVMVTGEDGKYVVTGEARTKGGEFFYIVEDGHNELVKEKRKRIGSKYPKWSRFTIHITIPKKDIPQNGTVTLYLFEKTGNGEMIHTYPVILEQSTNN